MAFTIKYRAFRLKFSHHEAALWIWEYLGTSTQRIFKICIIQVELTKLHYGFGNLHSSYLLISLDACNLSAGKWPCF